VLISDDVGEIMTTSNRLLIMRNGRVVFASDTARVDANEISEKIISSFDA
jgi:simple sugar transport system ATP-binding protein